MMNKDSIYKLIGYQGEYDINVKKAIRKLLKENHPDNKGNRRIFELINEVKKELENNKVSFDYKNNSININDDIDYLYCSKMIDMIKKKKKIYTSELEKRKKELAHYNYEYKNNYRNSLDLETYLLSNSSNMGKLKRIKILSVLLIILASILFFISIWEKSLFFLILFVIVIIICVIIVHKAFTVIQIIAESNREKLASYVSTNSNLRYSQNNQERLRKEIYEINKKINILENDLRFYNNIFNNRG